MALLSRASCDIASKMVTGRLAKTLFRERMDGSADLDGQPCGLPYQDPTGQVLVVRQAIRLGGQRHTYRALARTAGETPLLAFGIGNVLRIEAGKWHHHGVRIGLDSHLVGLADVDQKVTPLGDALRYLLRRQILNAVCLTRHQDLPKRRN